jgi:hypothetical protein
MYAAVLQMFLIWRLEGNESLFPVPGPSFKTRKMAHLYEYKTLSLTVCRNILKCNFAILRIPNLNDIYEVDRYLTFHFCNYPDLLLLKLIQNKINVSVSPHNTFIQNKATCFGTINSHQQARTTRYKRRFYSCNWVWDLNLYKCKYTYNFILYLYTRF